MNRRLFLSLLAAPGLAWSPQGSPRRRATPGPVPAGTRAQTLRSVRALPAEIAGVFREPAAFEQAASGQYFVFDRLAHTVYGIDADMQGSWKIAQIGQEAGRIIEPTAFALSPNGTFAVADRPRALERIQFFGPGGNLLGGFTLPGRPGESVVVNSVVLNGVGSLQYDGRTVFLSQPESGSLFTQYSPAGVPMRTFGVLRATGHEAERDLHLALNTGLPLVHPRGGFCFVFQTGIPVFRRYDAEGRLLFERHIEGRELDPILAALPTRWPTRTAGGRETPMVPPVVRTARVDQGGQLWVSFAGLPYTYVYDEQGEKVRVVQFRAAGLVMPTSLFFTAARRLLVTPGCYEFQP